MSTARISGEVDLDVELVDEVARAQAVQAMDAAVAAGQRVDGLTLRLGLVEGRVDDDEDDEARQLIAQVSSKLDALALRADDDEDEEARATAAEAKTLANQALAKIATGQPSGGTSSTYAGQPRFDVSALPGADGAEKFRAAVKLSAASGQYGAYPPGFLIDVRASPIDLPPQANVGCGSGVATEFGGKARLNVRATGGRAIFRPLSTSGDPNPGKGWSMSHMEVFGTGQEDLFETQAGDATQRVIAYSILDNVCVNQMRRVYHGPQTGMKIIGFTMWNNFTDTPFAPSGSDGTFFPQGLLFEMGGVIAPEQRALLEGMIRQGHLSKTTFGSIYITGSPTIPIIGLGGKGGVDYYGARIEGRPSNQNGALACWGPLVRLKGGGTNFHGGTFGYAMWKPAAGDKAYVHAEGGYHGIHGSTYMPYPGKYVPLAYVAAGHLTVKGVNVDPSEVAGMVAQGYHQNGVAKPVVLVKDIAPQTSEYADPAKRLAYARDRLLEADNSVTVKLAA